MPSAGIREPGFRRNDRLDRRDQHPSPCQGNGNRVALDRGTGQGNRCPGSAARLLLARPTALPLLAGEFPQRLFAAADDRLTVSQQ